MKFTQFTIARDIFVKKLVLILGILSLVSCSSEPKRIPQTYQPIRPVEAIRPQASIGPFPKPQALSSAVDFWRKTYGEWSRSQVAIHDDRYLDMVYEVVSLPNVAGEGLDGYQKDMIEQYKSVWRERLTTLDMKMRYQAELTAEDKSLLQRIQKSGKLVDSFLPGAADRVRAQRGTKERFRKGIDISRAYISEFKKTFREAGLPEELAYLPHVESSFQPHAKSSAGAVGMWQFTKGAAKTFMPDHNDVDRRLDPFVSAQGAANYLSYAYRKLGNWPSAVTSYNHGIGGMNKAQNTVGADFSRIVSDYNGPAFGFASRNYYAQFLAALELAS